jgi:hypothetical protein
MRRDNACLGRSEGRRGLGSDVSVAAKCGGAVAFLASSEQLKLRVHQDIIKIISMIVRKR